MKRNLFLLVALCVTLSFTHFANAGPGHDHGDGSPAATGPALPRFATQSDLFDAVGVLGKDELIVFIDRAATNEPVLNATIELESGGVKAVGTFETALGEYHFDGKPFQATAVYPITLTIKAGNDSDLLTGELDVHGAEPAATKTASTLPHTFREHPIWVAVGVFGIFSLVGAFIWSTRMKSRSQLRERSVA